MQKFIVPILIILAIGLGIYLYTDYNSSVEEKISIEKERLVEEKERKEKLEQEIKGLQEEIEKSKSTIQTLNEKVNSLNATNEELKTSKNKVESRLNSYAYQLKKQLKKEKDKIAGSKIKIVALINEQLSGLLDHRIRKISIFNDDSSFAYYTGRRNYIELGTSDLLKLERTVHFTSTGQYLQKIYQDKDNANNRFLISQYNVPITNLDFKSASIKDLSKKEKRAFDNDFREETYVSIEIPVKNSSSLIDLVETVEYNEDRFDKKSKAKSIDFYTSSKEEAEEVLVLLNILNELV